MKKLFCFILLFGFSFVLVNSAHAVSFGDNVGAPTIYVFKIFVETRYLEFDAGLAGLEVSAIDFILTDAGAGPTGLHYYKGRTRIKIFSNAGAKIYTSDWIRIKTEELYDPTTGKPNCADGNPPYGGNPCVWPDGTGEEGWFFSVGIADHSGGKYLILGFGFRAFSESAINGKTDHNLFKVRVIDLSDESIVRTFRFKDNVSGKISAWYSEVKDYDGDGDDELIILRDLYLSETKTRERVIVFDLLTGTKEADFTFVEHWPN